MSDVRDKDSKKRTIQVAVRVRPMNGIERAEKGHRSVKVDKRKLVVKNHLTSVPTDKQFNNFDHVYGPQSTQLEVYKDLVCPLLEEVLQGYNGTIFAYGQTGTGKTFTMEGERAELPEPWDAPTQVGIIPRTLQHVFDRLEAQELAEFSVRVSFMELYNEEVFDLLGPIDPHNCKRKLFEDPHNKGSVVVQGLEEVVVRDRKQVYEILKKGTEKRKTAETLLNAHSSRSHAIFSINVHVRENDMEGREMIKQGKLNLVDLAGSENIGRSGAVKERAKEAGTINQSLLTLGRVISSLEERRPHIPYRESKLTRLLKDSLGGRTITTIIATLSPSSTNLEETLSTLDYAERAKNIKNTPAANQKVTQVGLIKDYTDEIERLRKDLAASRDKNGVFLDEENYNAMKTEIVQKRAVAEELLENIDAVKGELTKWTDDFKDMDNKWRATWRKKERLEEKLQHTKQQYKYTKVALSEANRENEKTRFVLDAHIHTEHRLRQQANKLASVSNEATCEVVELHGKVDRSKSLISSNKATMQSHCQQSVKGVLTLQQNTNDAHANMHDNHKQMINNIDSVHEDQTKHGNEMVKSVDVLTKNVNERMEDIEQIFTDAIKHNVHVLVEARQNLASDTELQVSEIDSVLNRVQEVVGALVCIGEDMHTKVVQSLQQTKQQMTELGDSFQKHMATMFQLHRDAHTQDLQRQTVLENEHEIRVQQNEQLKSHATSLAESMKVLVAQIQKMELSESPVQNELHADMQLREQRHVKITEGLVKLGDECIIPVSESVMKLCEDTEKENAALVNNIINSRDECNKRIASDRQTLSKAMTNTAEKVCSSVKTSEKGLKDMKYSLIKQHTEMREAMGEDTGKFKQATHNMHKALADNVAAMKLSCEEREEIVKECNKQSNEWIDEHSEQIQKLMNQWKDVTNTGQTPAKHSFHYDAEIVEEVNRNVVAAQFEQENEPIELDLDASSVFDESSFMMSPPSAKTPQSATSGVSQASAFSALSNTPLRTRNV